MLLYVVSPNNTIMGSTLAAVLLHLFARYEVQDITLFVSGNIFIASSDTWGGSSIDPCNPCTSP